MIDGTQVADMLAQFMDPEIAKIIGAVRTLADYDISTEQAAPFLRFHAFISDPPPAYIAAWRSEPALESKWYLGHVGGLDDVRGALAAAHYHAERLFEIETNVTALMAANDFKERLGRSSMGLGGTRKMDFEYQAFVLAYRRSLDYLAGALACYFKTEASSFRTLPKSIRKAKCQSVVLAITEAQNRHVGHLDFVLAEGRKSVRHRIAHYGFVSAGCVNLTPNGFFIVGGGEDLRKGPNFKEATLEQVITEKLELLHDCVRDVIDSFIDAAREEENACGR